MFFSFNEVFMAEAFSVLCVPRLMEIVHVELPHERGKVVVLEVAWQHFFSELIGFLYNKSSSVSVPLHSCMVFWILSIDSNLVISTRRTVRGNLHLRFHKFWRESWARLSKLVLCFLVLQKNRLLSGHCRLSIETFGLRSVLSTLKIRSTLTRRRGDSPDIFPI